MFSIVEYLDRDETDPSYLLHAANKNNGSPFIVIRFSV